MSLFDAAATPCPGPRSDWSGSTDIWDDGFDAYEDTGAIDFTTEIKAPVLRAAKPRRAKTATFTIHEDGEKAPSKLRSETETTPLKKRTVDRKSAMFAQPAQRFKPKVSFAVSPSHETSTKRTMPHARPVAARAAINQKQSLNREDKSADTSLKKDALKKDVRRNTVYIPPEDTTVASVFMKIFSPVKSQKYDGVDTGVMEDTQINSLEAQISKKRAAKRSPAAPRRTPLQQSLKVQQESTIRADIAGQNGGKENIPPGGLLAGSKEKNDKADLPVCELPLKNKSNYGDRLPSSGMTKSQSVNVLSATKAETRAITRTVSRSAPKPVLGVRQNCASSVSMKSGVRKASTSTARTVTRKNPASVCKSSTLSSLSTSSRSKDPPSNLTIPNVPVKLDQKYPLLAEDISNPAMYEDNWLAHQEIVITQLVNGLFDSSSGNLQLNDPDILRHDLLEIYMDQPFKLLYKRLQASILYGALGIPKDVLARGSRWKEDLGAKRKFLDFWMRTYDLTALRAAAETVIGRRISVPSRMPINKNGSLTDQTAQKREKTFRRTLEAFLETFLIRNEDQDQATAELKAGEGGAVGWGYRRMVLRSILMIVLLDKARTTAEISLPRRLFNVSSPYKSSAAVLQGLGNMLLPSVGDINRTLSHLDCQASYVQHPLQEYGFCINNLAVDLRDGVLLTRLVELLLYPSASKILSRQHDPDVSTTVAMPSGEALPLLDGENDWPLSQHLKLPCVGRVTKLFNVQIALSALQGVKSVGVIVNDIRAEDIVDGHREKTIALLWSLVGKWGLEGLIDWDDVRKEIIRLERMASLGPEDVQEDDVCEEDFDDGYEKHAFLLKKWAAAIAGLKGLQLTNLSTSFADGRIFEAIVDEYEEYIIGPKLAGGSVSDNVSDAAMSKKSAGAALGSRLRALGCSSQFATLVSTSAASPRIFDRDFTLASLAFLCSRLLSASKRTRAALVLQSAWRRILTRRVLYRRAAAQAVARQCAAVVQTRDRILWAKGVIVTWWRQQKSRRARRIARTRNGSVSSKVIRKLPKPGFKSTLPVAVPKRQSMIPTVLHQKQRERVPAISREPAESAQGNETQSDIWLSL
ncbi:calmodulin-binding protein Sha1 [Paecilomyces variotii No. 5]|uniref:Calmodulin-binding protein Sha1 n=1 Tax=Byssochlamys spectabilis (strain No. 5 / NBRC 109023) TaxID=1356009 RepID=V5FC16_BYSSN|nr:calmodulin-binding protein Sha1 [Paecilomyces variotii No. 5]